MSPAGPHRDPALLRMAHAVLMPGFESVPGYGGGARTPDWLARAIDAGLGAVCCFAPNLAADPAALTRELHGRRADLLVTSDEEGGRVTRLHAAAGSPYPGHGELGTADDVDRTRSVAEAMGRELRDVGIDAALAPVLDVNVDPRNPVIGDRAFGADAALVARHGVAFAQGLAAAGTLAAGKHFPGHGDTAVDSHTALPVIDVDLPTLHRRELVPFGAAVDAGVPMVMSGHIVIPALDDAPASLSPRCYALLRTELGFTGAAVTDALDMRAVTGFLAAPGTVAGVARGAVAALRAGADLLCLGNPYNGPEKDEEIFRAALEAVLTAVADGTVPPGRLAEAADRVARLPAAVPHRGGGH
ncbi:glycoside hydrolase family 3 N-terminal domain-containing protein [Marinactinospora rubrisoli]|uniref:Glycoside hydrolase family 3 N-terminal domain-containing protein n=1 Tax=Marinactinospora rubrisoli TaxID=2715399 RepID=A0ABW2KLL0_9ACTN